ncbi:MAG: tetratricopeptide repeat protein [Candidatus Kapabacteria bacterium]|nr:tetratricopeptide repeat protein [Candidatus Kapabacteria bacterium]
MCCPLSFINPSHWFGFVGGQLYCRGRHCAAPLCFATDPTYRMSVPGNNPDLVERLTELERRLTSGTASYAQLETDVQAFLDELSTTDSGSGGEHTGALRNRGRLLLGNCLCQRGMNREALPIAESVLTLYRAQGTAENIAQASSLVGRILMNVSEYARAEDHLEIALQTFTDLKDVKGIAQVTSNLGILCQRRSEFPQALERYETALDLYAETSNDLGVARTCGNIGGIHVHLSDYGRALEYYEKALLIYERLDVKQSIATILRNIGLVHDRLGDTNLAMECFERALGLNIEIGDKLGEADATSSIGSSLRSMNEYDGALAKYERALSLYNETGYRLDVAEVNQNIGMLFSYKRNYLRALEHFEKAREIYQDIGDQVRMASIVGGIADIYSRDDFEGRDVSFAESSLLDVLRVFESAGIKSNQAIAHQLLSNLYETMGDWKSCVHHLRRHVELEEETRGVKVTRQAQQYEHQRRQAAIERERIVERAAADARISEQQKLLHLMLPAQVAKRLLNGEHIADYYEKVSILFVDIVGFTPIAARMPAKAVLALLNHVFSEFDQIAERHGCERIKTIGDGYLVVAGAPEECSDHAERIARAAIDIMAGITVPEDIRRLVPKDAEFHLRAGIHTGSVFAGIVGDKRFGYDVCSDAVNLASRMETSCEPGKIQCSSEFAYHLQNRDDRFQFEERGEIEVRGKGLMRTFYLTQVRG